MSECMLVSFYIRYTLSVLCWVFCFSGKFMRGVDELRDENYELDLNYLPSKMYVLSLFHLLRFSFR